MPRKYRKRTKRKLKPRARQNYAGTARYQLANRVELIRPISLKPKSVMKKFIYYNTSEVVNNLIGGTQNAQHMTMYLNSPWFVRSTTYSDQGTNTWRWNKALGTHANGDDSTVGTSFDGLFSDATSVGNQYQDACIVGAKTTITATPTFYSSNASPGAITALFAVIQTQDSDLDQTTTIDQLYQKPYCQVRKIVGSQNNAGDIGGNSKDASIVVRYSPKRFNNIKDIRDNGVFFSKVDRGGTNGRHPNEIDRLTFGLVNVVSNPATPRKCCPVALQIKHEVTMLFSEPFNSQNQYPAAPMFPGNVGQAAANVALEALVG